MPKDPTGVRPQGVLSRHPADFFSDSLATAGYLVFESPPAFNLSYNAVGLFNNDPQGKVFRVYGVTIQDDAGGGVGLYFVNRQLSTPRGSAFSLRPDRPSPSGLIFADTTTVPSTAPVPTAYNPQVSMLATNGFDGSEFFSPFPIAIVPPGWSLVALNLEPAGQVGTYFWYQIANQ